MLEKCITSYYASRHRRNEIVRGCFNFSRHRELVLWQTTQLHSIQFSSLDPRMPAHLNSPRAACSHFLKPYILVSKAPIFHLLLFFVEATRSPPIIILPTEQLKLGSLFSARTNISGCKMCFLAVDRQNAGRRINFEQNEPGNTDCHYAVAGVLAFWVA